MAFKTLTAEVEGAIGRLTLNRPQKLNPLSREALAEIAEAARWFDTNSDVKVVVVGGAGRAFSAGADLGTFQGQPEGDLRAAADQGRLMAEAVESMRAVTIAAIQGWCVGGGLVLAAACDLRLAADSAKFSIPEVDLGIPLAWGGIPRLVREIGPARTKELVMTCRPFEAAEAQAIGFLNRVVPESSLPRLLPNWLTPGRQSLTCTAVDQKARQCGHRADAGHRRSWADADGLVVGLGDAEGVAAREAYLKGKDR